MKWNLECHHLSKTKKLLNTKIINKWRLELFLIDSTNMLYREGFYKFCLCPNLKFTIPIILNFLQKLHPKKKIYKWCTILCILQIPYSNTELVIRMKNSVVITRKIKNHV